MNPLLFDFIRLSHGIAPPFLGNTEIATPSLWICYEARASADISTLNKQSSESAHLLFRVLRIVCHSAPCDSPHPLPPRTALSVGLVVC